MRIPSISIGILLLLSALFGQSCQNTSSSSESAEPESSIEAVVYIRYITDDQALKAEVGMEQIFADSAKAYFPSKGIFFDGGAMSQTRRSGQRSFFVSNRRGEPKASLPIIYSTPKGIMDTFFVTSTSLNNPTFRNSVAPNTIKYKFLTTLEWEGAPMAKNEKVVLIFTDKNNQAATLELIGPTSKSEISLSTESLKDLVPGELQFYAVRKSEELIERPNFRAAVVMEYYSNTSTVNFKK